MPQSPTLPESWRAAAGCVPARVSPVAHVRVVRSAGHRAGHTDHASHRGRHARRGWDGRGGVVPRGVPVLLPPCLRHRPARADAGPADRVPVARRRRGDRRGGRRHAVSPVGAEGVRRVPDPRRLRAGPQRARPRQPVDHHRDRRRGAVLRTPGVLPVLFRLWRGKGTASPVQLARELISILAQVFPNRLVHAVGDAAYHGKALLVPATTITTRSPGQRRPLRAGAATHGQAVLEMVQERGDEWGVKVFDLQFRR